MKRITSLSILILVPAFYYGIWQPARPEALATPGKVRQTTTAALPATQTRAAATSMPVASMVRAPSLSPLTDDRRRIFDSPDLMAAINRVHFDGTSDEKEWALSLLVICVQINARTSTPQPDASDRGQDQSASTPSEVALVALKKHAVDELTARCSGVKPLAKLSDRQFLEDDLRAAAIANHSVLRGLEVLASSQEDRWNSEQAKQITDSLYSGDPVLARAAFFALLGAMDRDSPGGQDRNEALMSALGPIYTEVPLSDFERLAGCAAIGRCGSVGGTDSPVPPPDAAVLRLTRQYRAAVESRLDARSIMAIR